MQIINSATRAAANVMVRRRVVIEPGFRAGGFDFADDPLLLQPLEVSVDCPETDPRQRLPDRIVELSSRRMSPRGSKRFKHGFTLASISMSNCFLQHLITLIVTIIDSMVAADQRFPNKCTKRTASNPATGLCET
jgi:hypothetical protein